MTRSRIIHSHGGPKELARANVAISLGHADAGFALPDLPACRSAWARPSLPVAAMDEIIVASLDHIALTPDDHAGAGQEVG